MDRWWNKQTIMRNNGKHFWGSREQCKSFWDQGILSLKHNSQQYFINGEQGIMDLSGRGSQVDRKASFLQRYMT